MNRAEDMLRSMAQAWRRLGVDQFVFQEWLLGHGEGFGPALKRPKGLRLRTIKRCYSNTMRALMERAVDRGEWFYTEGVVLGHNLPLLIDHAWLSNRKGEVIDLTLRKQEGASYFGVPFAWDYAERKTFEHGYFGLFSNGICYNKDVLDTASEGRSWPKQEGEREAA